MGTKISELTAATSLAGTETVALVQSGTTKSATVSLLRGVSVVAAGQVSAAGALSGEVGVASASLDATGDFTITLDSAPTSGRVICSPNAAGVAAQNGAFTGAAVNILTFDMAGAAASVGFNFIVVDLG